MQRVSQPLVPAREHRGRRRRRRRSARGWPRWSSKYFGDWQVPGKPTPQPDFGAPDGARAAAIATNPVGETQVLVEPGQPRQLQLCDPAPVAAGDRQDRLQPRAADRRWSPDDHQPPARDPRARRAAASCSPRSDGRDVSRSADGTFVDVTPLGEDWRAALADVRAVIADAVATPPTQAEIDREVARVRRGLRQRRSSSAAILAGSQARRRRGQRGRHSRDGRRARDDPRRVPRHEAALHAGRGATQHTKALFTGTVIRAVC